MQALFMPACINTSITQAATAPQLKNIDSGLQPVCRHSVGGPILLVWVGRGQEVDGFPQAQQPGRARILLGP